MNTASAAMPASSTPAGLWISALPVNGTTAAVVDGMVGIVVLTTTMMLLTNVMELAGLELI